MLVLCVVFLKRIRGGVSVCPYNTYPGSSSTAEDLSKAIGRDSRYRILKYESGEAPIRISKSSFTF